MPTVMEPKERSAGRFGSQVDEQILQTTSRIRGHDMVFGGLVLFAMLLVYATGMILLDRYFGLPEWARQASLAGFGVAFAAVAYLTIVRSLMRQVNPLYAAVQVEKTIDDAKNSVLGYVEARRRGTVHPTIEAAMSARAARSVGKADLNRAVDHRSLIYTGAVAVIFLVSLAILFLIFRPSQFSSLLGRAFVPFTSDPIATRTRLTVTKPDPAEATVTAGQSVSIGVNVAGRIPDPSKPDRLRVLVRHNPADPNYDEVPLETGESNRDWQVRLPDYLVQNGFWYKVAGGDAETPEFKVTVRSLPLCTSFEVAYEYPAYLRRKAETVTGPHLEVYLGTKVTITAHTNREVKDGRIVLQPSGQAFAGSLVPGQPEAIRFEFPITESLNLKDGGAYKLYFTSTTGEKNLDPPANTILYFSDQPPTVQIVNPEQEEVILPANGQLAVDGTIGDDFGIDKATLKLQLAGDKPKPLADKPYMGGKSFHRERDNTWPTSLDYKDSVDFLSLTDVAGAKVELKEGMILEYWLEAVDNCTEPKPNVGRSKVKRVRMGPPQVEAEDKANQKHQKTQRKAEEKKHDAAQQQKLDQEKREPNKGQGEQQPPQEGDQQKTDPNGMGMGQTQPMNGGNEGNPMPKADGTQQPKGMNNEPNKTQDKTTDPNTDAGNDNTGKPGQADKQKPDAGNTSKENNGQAGKPPEAIDKQADDVQKQIEKDRQGGGDGKGSTTGSDTERSDPSQAKDNPAGSEKPGSSPEKNAPKPSDSANPKSSDNSQPAESRAESNPQPSTPQAEPKKTPAAEKTDPMKGGNDQPAQARDEPLGGSSGQEKEAPQSKPKNDGGNPMPKTGNGSDAQKQDPASGGSAKEATAQPKSDGSANKLDNQKPMTGSQQDPAKPSADPAAGAASNKGDPKPESGSEKPSPAGEQGASQNKTPMENSAGAGKTQQTPEAAISKPAPKDGSNGGNAAQPKPAPEKGTDPSKPDSAAEARPQGDQPKGPNDSQSQSNPSGMEKPIPRSGDTGTQKGNDGKGSDEARKEIENAVRDLNSSDPKKQKEARDNLDQMVGKKAREDAEQTMKDLQSDDKATRDAAKKKVEEAIKKAGGSKQEGSSDGAKPELTEKEKKDIEDAANDLSSSDKAKQRAARDKLDKTVGEGARKDAEQTMKDLQSDDKATRDAARKKVEEAAKKAGEGKKDDSSGGTQSELTEKQKKDIEDAARDLNSTDKAKQQAARDKLDKTVGEGAHKDAEQTMKDLQSDDKATRDAAKKKVEEAAKKAGEGKKDGSASGAQSELTDKQKKDVEDAERDLNSSDKGKQQAARDKLDKAVGDAAKKDAEQTMKDLQSKDSATREAAKKKIEEMAKGKDTDSGKPQDKQLSPQEIADLAKKAGDLNSPDKDKREAAEKAFDEKVGKANREKLQQKPNEAQAKEALEEMARQAEQERQRQQAKKDPTGKSGQGDLEGDHTPKAPGSVTPPLNAAIKADPKNAAKTAELQLEQFEKNRDNKELHDKLGWTQEEYNRFLEGYKQRVEDLKKQAVAPELTEKAPPPAAGPPTANVSGGTRVQQGPNAASGAASRGGPVVAPPGFENAKKRFQEGATKVPPPQQK